ncbi:shikimate kinase [Euzebya tangerina]|uniref:shikimate kinase n=1 Tax=Euzebya tangerina TaxID=591198 RepID=UPI000E314A36|nr:shikimate kinase [Euzebya tangerina]
MSVNSPGRNIVLIGMMGSGKTTVGRHVAKALGRPFVDTDDVVEGELGKPISQIFDDQGERVFRAAETEAVRRVAAIHGQVVAVGGGAVLDPVNVTHLSSTGDLVWLDAPVHVLMANLTSKGEVEARPLLATTGPDRMHARLAAMREERLEAYHRAATAALATDDRAPEVLADEIIRWAAGQPGLLAREERP